MCYKKYIDVCVCSIRGSNPGPPVHKTDALPTAPMELNWIYLWTYSVMVNTSDSESDNPGSNPGRSIYVYIYIALVAQLDNAFPS